MGSQAITAGIFGTIVLVLAFILYTPLVDGMDGLILYWSDSCEYNNERYVRGYVGGQNIAGSASNAYDTAEKKFYGSGATVKEGAIAGDCAFDAFTVVPSTLAPADTTGVTIYNERGQVVYTEGTLGAARTTAGSVGAQANIGDDHGWRDVPTLLTQFGGIGKLVLSVLPIVVLASYLGVAGMGLIQYGRGLSNGGIVNAVGGAIVQLIVYVVLLKIMPVVIEAMVGGSSVTGGQYTVTGTFGSVINIVFAAAPILLVVALMGSSAYMLYSKSRTFRSSGAMGGMG